MSSARTSERSVTYRVARALPGADPKHYILVLEGAQQGSRSRPGAIIEEELGRYGTPVAVDYPEGRFDAELIAQGAATRFTFVAISMGGLIAHDIVAELMSWGIPDSVIFEFILIDAPTGAKDLVDKRAWLTKYIPQIPTPRWLNGLLLNGGGELPPCEREFEGEEREIWLRQVNESRHFPIAVMLGGQTRYIVTHPGPRRDVLNRVAQIAILRSSTDIVVEADADDNWRRAAGEDREIIVFDVKNRAHADILEFARTWAHQIGRVLGMFSQQI